MVPMTTLAKSSNKQELEAVRVKLETLIASYAENGGEPQTPVPGLYMAMTTTPLPTTAYLYEPSLCMCVRGRKHISFGKESLSYDQNHYLLTCIDIPVLISIADASPAKPYAGIMIQLDLEMVRAIVAEMEISGIPVEHAEAAVAVRAVELPLLDAVYRLARLAGQKQDIGIMAPLIQREILYRLLSGPSGDRLRHIAQFGSQSNRVNKAVSWIRENYRKSFVIEDLAAISGMGISTFHRHFQTLTTMSPVQYQKHLRLHEARRLMLVEDRDAAESAFEVGYESVTQFNREYRRLFGQPPATNKRKLQESSHFAEVV